MGGSRQRQVGDRLPRRCRRHLTGVDRSVEYAVLGRMAAEMEYELLSLIDA